MSRLVFLDTETTGLDPLCESIFEIAVIAGDGTEHVWRPRVLAHHVTDMHPIAAEVNRYHERTAAPDWRWQVPRTVALDLWPHLAGAHIVGAVPDFDTRHLTVFYDRLGIAPPDWHYHLIDVEVAAYGWLLYRDPDAAWGLDVPWDSDELAEACGVEPPTEDERHTALGDARWVKRWWDTLHDGGPLA